jgi:hypothetical protein
LILPPGFVAVNPLPSRQSNEGQEGVRAQLKITVARQMPLYALTSLQVVQAPHYSTSPGPTTHSFEPRDFPETAREPAIGGLLRLRFGLRENRFWPKGDFGRFVSGPRNPVSPMQIDPG